MKTKTILKTLAVALLMPAMLLTTACSNEDDLTNNTVNSQPVANKGYALPVTVNATRGGDATRATFDGSKLNFGTGDKLFVRGIDNNVGGAGQFAGELTWQSGGTFSGTIYTQNVWTGTADALFTAASAGTYPECYVRAILLPNGYQSTGFLSIDNNSTTDKAYDDRVEAIGSNAFVASETAKATGVEQLSYERATSYSSGFALAPVCAILNFTISGLEDGAKTVRLYGTNPGGDFTVEGSVTPNASGVATFAIGITGGNNIKDGSDNLKVGTHNFTLPSTTVTAGKIYNITRGPIPGVLNGQFSVSATKKVNFSKGNLQYQASTGTWRFAEHQYDYVGDATNGNVYVGSTKSNNANISSSYDGWIDLFGWGTGNNPNQTSTSDGDYGTFTDWGVNMGSGWRTLTGGYNVGEWRYLFNTRSASTVNGTANARFAKAKVCNVQGVILFPDTYTHPDGVTAPVGINATDATGWNGNNYSSADWTKMESAGCVFLPAAGRRDGTWVTDVGSYGLYWSATSEGSSYRFRVYFYSGELDPRSYSGSKNGQSVRLVRDAN